MEYSLSIRGKSLIEILDLLCIWGEKNREIRSFIDERTAFEISTKEGGNLSEFNSLKAGLFYHYLPILVKRICQYLSILPDKCFCSVLIVL